MLENLEQPDYSGTITIFGLPEKIITKKEYTIHIEGSIFPGADKLFFSFKDEEEQEVVNSFYHTSYSENEIEIKRTIKFKHKGYYQLVLQVFSSTNELIMQSVPLKFKVKQNMFDKSISIINLIWTCVEPIFYIGSIIAGIIAWKTNFIWVESIISIIIIGFIVGGSFFIKLIIPKIMSRKERKESMIKFDNNNI